MAIPEQLLPEIFSHLPLVGIIRARSVCKSWRNNVLLADIHPARVKLYHFYLRCISSETFQRSRKSFIPRLTPFDREAYIANLERQYPHIPDEFAFWILEWPAKAVTDHYWPGFPCKSKGDEMFCPEGTNALARSSPTVEVIASYELGNGKIGHIRGLKVVNMVGMNEAWIVFDAPRREIRGSVAVLGPYTLSIKDGEIEGGRNASSWVEWLQGELEGHESLETSPMYLISQQLRRN